MTGFGAEPPVCDVSVVITIGGKADPSKPSCEARSGTRRPAPGSSLMRLAAISSAFGPFSYLGIATWLRWMTEAPTKPGDAPRTRLQAAAIAATIDYR